LGEKNERKPRHINGFRVFLSKGGFWRFFWNVGEKEERKHSVTGQA
jgi:hypothetical protein